MEGQGRKKGREERRAGAWIVAGKGGKACRQRLLVGFPAAQTKTITQKLY